MKKGNLSVLLWWALAAAAVLLGVQAWRMSRQTAVVIAWETASEMDTAGFNLYRGEQETGPFQRVNETLIPGSADPITGGAYEFVDSLVTPGKTYYYQLEEVELSGARVVVETTAVQAQAGGQLELVLAGVLFGLAVLGLLSRTRGRRPAAQGADGWG